MSDPHASQTRIGQADAPEQTIGCGLLVTPRHVLTCAHVVADALGCDAGAAAIPAGRLPVDLPLLPQPFRSFGRVVHWLPLRDSGEKTPEDLAVLELDRPAPPAAEPAHLLSLGPDDYTDLAVHCFGFPAAVPEGTRRPGTWVEEDRGNRG